MPGSVAPPARRDEIEPAITVEVARGKPIPAARDPGESPFTRHVAQTPVLVMKHANGPPLGGEREAGPAVAIQIGEDSRRDETHGSEHTVVDGIGGPSTVRQTKVDVRSEEHTSEL